MKIYLKVIGLLSFLFISFGYILPFLFSHKSDELPIIGVLYSFIFVPFVLVLIIKSLLK